MSYTISRARTHRECSFPEDNDVHVERFEVGWAVRVLVETTEADKVVVPEKFDLFSCFFHLDILSREWMNMEDLQTEGYQKADT